MLHDPQRLEATYGPLRRHLQAAGLAVAYPHELPPHHQSADGLCVAPTREHLATLPAVTVVCVERVWFLMLHESPARQVEVADAQIMELVVALVSAVRELPPSRAPASIRSYPRWRFEDGLLQGFLVRPFGDRRLDERREWAFRRQHEALGWRVLTDEAFVRSQLERFSHTFHDPDHGYRLPEPSRVWDTSAHAGLPSGVREDQERDLTLAALGALRAATQPGEQVLVLDWMSTCWQFNPHAPIVDAYRESWARGFLGEETLYWIDPAYRFGIITDWRGLRFRAFGAAVVEALETSAPAVLRPLAPDAPSDRELDEWIRAHDGEVPRPG